MLEWTAACHIPSIPCLLLALSCEALSLMVSFKSHLRVLACAVLQVLKSRLAALTTLVPRLWRPAMTAIAPRPGCALVHKALLVACLQSVSIHAAASLRHPSVVLLHLACRALVDNLKRASENCDYQQHCKAALRIQECCSCRCFSPTRTSLTQDLTCVWSCAPPCLLRVGCLTWTS